MIGMTVRIDHRVEPVDSRPHGLGAKIGGRVDHHAASAIIEQHRRPHPLVERVARFAHSRSGIRELARPWMCPNLRLSVEARP